MIVRAWLGAGVVGSTLLLTGCAQFNKVFDNEGEGSYQRSGSIQSLDLPPDLTSPQYDSTFTVNDANATISAQTASANGNVAVLPESVDMAFKGQGASRYLEVALPAEVLWQKIQDFWRSTGIKLKRNEPQIGIVETDWIEKQGDLPQGAIQKLLGSIFKNVNDTGTRDRYTLRLERVGSKTNLYMKHRGAEQIVGDFGNSWEMRPSDPEKAAEMLNRLHSYLQKHTKKTEKTVTTRVQPTPRKIPITKPKMVAKPTSTPFSTPRAAKSLGVRPSLNSNVVLNTAGTLGANVVNLPKKKVAPVPQPVKVKRPVPPKPIAATQKAKKLAFLSSTNDGQPALGVRMSYKKIFGQMSTILKKADFAVDGKNVNNGLYAIRYKGSKGQKDIVKKNSKQILHIIRIGKVSAMRLLDINGQPLSAKKATKILRSIERIFNRS